MTGFLVALAGFIYPVLRYLQRSRAQGEGWPVGKTLGRMLLGAALSGVAFVATWGAVQWGPIWAGILVEQQMRATTVAESPASPADEAAFKEGAIPLKYKELMAVAVALTTQCPYCIEIHTKKAKRAGANETELAETTLVAAALRAGGAVTHGTHTLE